MPPVAVAEIVVEPNPRPEALPCVPLVLLMLAVEVLLEAQVTLVVMSAVEASV